MIYVKDLETDVVCFEEEQQLDGIKIDWLTNIDKCIFKKIKPIFETLGWDKDYEKIIALTNNKVKGQQTLC